MNGVSLIGKYSKILEMSSAEGDWQMWIEMKFKTNC